MHDWHGQTVLHPLGLTAVLVCGVALLLLPRRYATFPILVMACFVPPAQRIVVAGADFNLLRIMVLFGVVRILIRQDYRGIRLTPVDALLCMWAVSHALIFVAARGTPEAMLNRSGWMFDCIGFYFLFRCLIREWRDIVSMGYALSILSAPVAAAFLVERASGYNSFSLLGGVPEFTAIRDGRLRCQGAFAHPILAGTFWAVAMPLIAVQWWTHRSRRWLVVVGLASSLVVVMNCASSGPVLSVMAAAGGGMLFYLRRRIGWLVAGGVCGLVGLHFAMNKPVWHLVARVDVIGGSTGYHRYMLIDAFINNVEKWFFLGSTDMSYLADARGIVDITNQYIMEGALGGASTLFLFLAMLTAAFVVVLRAVRRLDRRPTERTIAWAVFVVLIVHAVSLMSVSYFGQIIMLWYASLAMASSVSVMAAVQTSVRVPAPAAAPRGRLSSVGGAA